MLICSKEASHGEGAQGNMQSSAKGTFACGLCCLPPSKAFLTINPVSFPQTWSFNVHDPDAFSWWQSNNKNPSAHRPHKENSYSNKYINSANYHSGFTTGSSMFKPHSKQMSWSVLFQVISMEGALSSCTLDSVINQRFLFQPQEASNPSYLAWSIPGSEAMVGCGAWAHASFNLTPVKV